MKSKGFFWKPTEEFSNIANAYLAVRPGLAEEKSTERDSSVSRMRGLEDLMHRTNLGLSDSKDAEQKPSGDFEIGASVSGLPPVIDSIGAALENADSKEYIPKGIDPKTLSAHKKLMASLTSDVDIA